MQATTVSTGLFSFSTRAWFYSNSLPSQGAVASNQLAFPGPTLKVKPGTMLSITLVNALGANPTTPSYTCCGAPVDPLACAGAFAAGAGHLAQAARAAPVRLRRCTDVLTSCSVLQRAHRKTQCAGMQLNSNAGSMPMPNTVNLHFHGLGTPPEQDSIFKRAQPGGTQQYTITIPSDHPPGCHWCASLRSPCPPRTRSCRMRPRLIWRNSAHSRGVVGARTLRAPRYHSHVHGAVAMHVMGGLVGSVCVEPADASVLPAALSAMSRYNLVLQHVSETSANPSDDPFM